MTVKAHISSVYSACRGHLRNICSIRHYLMQKPAASLVHFLITTRLDYANARLFGVHRDQTVCLQNMQNYAARIVTRTSTSDHIMPVLYLSCTCKVPHWIQGAQSNIQGNALTCTSIFCWHYSHLTFRQGTCAPPTNIDMLCLRPALPKPPRRCGTPWPWTFERTNTWTFLRINWKHPFNNCLQLD